MEVEFVILADAAQVADGKLFLLGAGWTEVSSNEFPSEIRTSIAISLLIDEADVGSHSVALNIADEAGTALVSSTATFQSAPPTSAVRRQRGMFPVKAQLKIPRPGRYTVTVAVGDSEKAVDFYAVPATPTLALDRPPKP
jgi:hypothetical protein